VVGIENGFLSQGFKHGISATTHHGHDHMYILEALHNYDTCMFLFSLSSLMYELEDFLKFALYSSIFPSYKCHDIEHTFSKQGVFFIALIENFVKWYSLKWNIFTSGYIVKLRTREKCCTDILLFWCSLKRGSIVGGKI
jgi:hypothetical protein